jgi:hypothetical protein
MLNERRGKGAYTRQARAFALAQPKKRSSLPTLGKRLKRWGVGEVLTMGKDYCAESLKTSHYHLNLYFIF